ETSSWPLSRSTCRETVRAASDDSPACRRGRRSTPRRVPHRSGGCRPRATASRGSPPHPRAPQVESRARARSNTLFAGASTPAARAVLRSDEAGLLRVQRGRGMRAHAADPNGDLDLPGAGRLQVGPATRGAERHAAVALDGEATAAEAAGGLARLVDERDAVVRALPASRRDGGAEERAVLVGDLDRGVLGE